MFVDRLRIQAKPTIVNRASQGNPGKCIHLHMDSVCQEFWKKDYSHFSNPILHEKWFLS